MTMTEAQSVQITERAFRQQVLDLAHLLGWDTYFTWSSIHSPAGWPDLALCRPPRLVLAELKTERGRVTPAQERWLGMLRDCPGVEVYLWRPADIERVAAVLR